LAFAIEGTTHAGEFSPKNSSTVVRQEPLWTSPALGSGPHTLVITQAVGLTGDGPVFLDYLMYAATAESTGVTSYFVDDRDPRIKYTGTWRLSGSQVDFQHTSQASSSKGDSFSFTFEGGLHFSPQEEINKQMITFNRNIHRVLWRHRPDR
jgi:hypothetical protein